MTKNADKRTTNADCSPGLAPMLSEMSVERTPPMTTTRHRGFTLIELLVVIAILGFIPSLVGPSVIKQIGGLRSTPRDCSRRPECRADLYTSIFRPLSPTERRSAALATAPKTAREWDGPYLKKSAVPSDPSATRISTEPSETILTTSTLTAPTVSSAASATVRMS